MINLYTPSGIGDIYWLLMKIIPNTTEGLHIHVPPGLTDVDKRAHFLKSVQGVEKISMDGMPL